ARLRLEDALAGADVDEGLDLLVGGGLAVLLVLLAPAHRLGGDQRREDGHQGREDEQGDAEEAGQEAQRPLRVVTDERAVAELGGRQEEGDGEDRPEQRMRPRQRGEERGQHDDEGDGEEAGEKGEQVAENTEADRRFVEGPQAPSRLFRPVAQADGAAALEEGREHRIADCQRHQEGDSPGEGERRKGRVGHGAGGAERKVRRRRRSRRSIVPPSVSWSWPAQCSRPWRSSTWSSCSTPWPAAAACRRAAGTEIRMSPRCRASPGSPDGPGSPGNDSTSVA